MELKDPEDVAIPLDDVSVCMLDFSYVLCPPNLTSLVHLDA